MLLAHGLVQLCGEEAWMQRMDLLLTAGAALGIFQLLVALRDGEPVAGVLGALFLAGAGALLVSRRGSDGERKAVRVPTYVVAAALAAGMIIVTLVVRA